MSNLIVELMGGLSGGTSQVPGCSIGLRVGGRGFIRSPPLPGNKLPKPFFPCNQSSIAVSFSLNN